MIYNKINFKIPQYLDENNDLHNYITNYSYINPSSIYLCGNMYTIEGTEINYLIDILDQYNIKYEIKRIHHYNVPIAISIMYELQVAYTNFGFSLN